MLMHGLSQSWTHYRWPLLVVSKLALGELDISLYLLLLLDSHHIRYSGSL